VDFDPYHEWLDIPPGRRPPDGRDLLGLAEGDASEEAIHRATMARYAKIRPYASAPDAQVAEHGQRILGEIAQAMSTLLRQCAATPELVEAELVTGPDYAAVVRESLCRTIAASVEPIPATLLGQAVSLFADRLQDDSEYVAVVKAPEPNSTMLFTDRTCHHQTDRKARSFAYADVAGCTGTRGEGAWLLYVTLRGQTKHKLRFTADHAFTAMRKMFRGIAEAGRSAP
jgi:hypothetical protein